MDSIRLLRFSHASDLESASGASWKHETRDLELTFDSYGASNSLPTILRVVQGASVLEAVNLADKVRHTNEAFARAAKSGRRLTGIAIPTTVLHRRTAYTIALRYPLDNGQIRRLQVKFASLTDFDRVLGYLRDIGCNLDAKPESQPPSSAQSIAGSARPTNSLFQHDRPASAYHSPTPFQQPPYDAPAPEAPLVQSSQHLYDRGSAFSPPITTQHRPSSSLFPIQEDESIHDDPVLQNMGSIDRTTQRSGPLERRMTAIPDATPTAASHATPRYHSEDSARQPPLSRPSTAPITSVDQLDAELNSLAKPPPARVLPFARPGSVRSSISRGGSNSRPSTSDQGELPRPSYINPVAMETSSTLAIQSMDVDETPARSTPSEPAKAAESAKRPQTATSSASRSAPKKKPLQTRPATAKATPKSSNKPSSSASSSTVKTSKKTPIPVSSDPPRSNEEGIPEPMHSALSQIASSMTSSHAGPARLSEKETLAAYAKMSPEERSAMLERMIVESIEDEDFVTLCEDVYGCWQRIGFG